MCRVAQFREVERLDDLIPGLVRILVEDPHGLCSVDRRATTDCDDPVRLELAHRSCALLDGLDGRIGLDALEQLHFEASVLEVLLDILQEAAAAHAVATGNDDCLLALEVLDLVASALSEVDITRIGKTTHSIHPFVCRCQSEQRIHAVDVLPWRPLHGHAPKPIANALPIQVRIQIEPLYSHLFI